MNATFFVYPDTKQHEKGDRSMNRDCRKLTQLDCGYFVYQGNRLPYITGCTIPVYPNALCAKTEYRILPTILLTDEMVGLRLDFYMLNPEGYSHHSVFLSYEEHQRFLEAVTEAQAIYLLDGAPLEAHPNNLPEFFRRLSQKGHGFTISDRLRQSIKVLHSLAPIKNHLIPSLSAPSLS
jgi:hypothetical protein